MAVVGMQSPGDSTQHPIFLSQLQLSPHSETVRHLLADCHKLHHAVMVGFPAARAKEEAVDINFFDGVDTLVYRSAARSQFGVLFRIEPPFSGPAATSRTEGRRLIVQSRIQPDWSRLPRRFLDEALGLPVTKRVDRIYANLQNGQTVLFRICANLTWRQGKTRVPMRNERDQVTWLSRKADEGGFTLLPGVTLNEQRDNAQQSIRTFDVQIKQLPDVTGCQPCRPFAVDSYVPDSYRRLTFGAVLFEGKLRITNKTLFLRTLDHGLGSGKAYGFGLLSIAAPSR